jgi:hypothetical protein
VNRRASTRQRIELASGVVLLVGSAGIAACIDDKEDDVVEQPKIVEVFACSDYCPGPAENYIKRIYEGVTDGEECRKLGGNPYTIIGWDKRTICEVPD